MSRLRKKYDPAKPLTADVLSYPLDQSLGYDRLISIVEEEARKLGDFVVVGESFSGPLALMLAARNPAGLQGVVLCASRFRFQKNGVGWSAPWISIGGGRNTPITVSCDGLVDRALKPRGDEVSNQKRSILVKH